MLSSALDLLRQACSTPPEQPSEDELRASAQQVMQAIVDDYLQLGEHRFGTTASRDEMNRLLCEPAPEAGMDFSRLLADFHERVLERSFRPSHPRFLAFIPGAPSFASVLADCLTSEANLFAGVWKEAAGATQVELVVLDWFKQFLGYPAEARGILTSGGSEANLTALVTAREPLRYEDRPRAVLYASEHRHWSVDRAAKIIGMRPDQIRSLPCDDEYRLRVDALHDAVAEDERAGRSPWVVLASAGTTNTGSVDPLVPLADFCGSHNLWLHVDAAYGWSMALTQAGKEVLAGIDRADSITLDPHKWFAQTFAVGCLLVRRGELLLETFMMRPEYMQDVVPREDEINFCDHGIALTRRFRALKIWFSIKLLGIAWFRQLIEHTSALAEYAQQLIASKGRFEITSGRKLSIVCFRYVPGDTRLTPEQSDALQVAINEELARRGRAFLSTTRLNGRTTLRFCFVNARTTASDVDEIVALLQEIGDQLSA